MPETIEELLSRGGTCEFEGVYLSEPYKFAVKPTAFQKLDKLPAGLEVRDVGVAWLLTFEVTNLRKRAHDSYVVREVVTLVDQEGFCFTAVNDNDFISETKFGKQHNLDRLSSWNDTPKLQPKLAARTALVFLLPPDPLAKYSLIAPQDEDDEDGGADDDGDNEDEDDEADEADDDDDDAEEEDDDEDERCRP